MNGCYKDLDTCAQLQFSYSRSPSSLFSFPLSLLLLNRSLGQSGKEEEEERERWRGFWYKVTLQTVAVQKTGVRYVTALVKMKHLIWPESKPEVEVVSFTVFMSTAAKTLVCVGGTFNLLFLNKPNRSKNKCECGTTCSTKQPFCLVYWATKPWTGCN